MIKKLEYRYIVAIIYILVLFIDRMDLTITNIALPTFAKEFNKDVTQVDWIATSFLIALGLIMPVSSWLSSTYGSKRIFILSNILFTFSSFLCAFAWDFYSLIFFRILQGIGGGLLIPIGMGMTYAAFQIKDYSKVANYTLIPTLVAPSIAPAFGGFILAYLNWRWIFFLHLPVGLVSIFMSYFFLKEDKLHIIKTKKIKFDKTGFCLLALSLTCLFYFLSQIGSFGLSNFQTKIFGLTFIISFIFFIVFQLNKSNSIINLKLFNNSLFSQSMVLTVILQICYFGSIFLIALYFQNYLHMSPFQSGLSMTGQSLGTICMLFCSSKMFNRYGPKYMIICGFVFISINTFFILKIQNPNQIILANIILWLRGLSIGMVNAPLQACAMLHFKKDKLQQASSIFNIIRQVGISLGIALSSMILAIQFRNTYFNSFYSYQFTFIIFSLIALLGAIISFTINNKRILLKLHHV